MTQTDKWFRVLEMYTMAVCGQPLRKKELAGKFNVTEKSIQRDIETLRAYFLRMDGGELVYDAKQRAYCLQQSTLDSKGSRKGIRASVRAGLAMKH